MKVNISQLENCYGCGVCVKVCPTHIISMAENTDGFYAPVIKEPQRCIECGLCLNVCAFNHDTPACTTDEAECYAAWSVDEHIRRDCSSGGAGYEIGHLLIDSGYKVAGVRYDAALGRAYHYIASSLGDLRLSMGSKYIQSDTSEALALIDRSQKYLFTGTPCQVDSMRRYVRQMRIEDNFVFLDFFCHGVPSLLIWDKYLEHIRQILPDIGHVKWRDKRYGWHDSWVMCACSDTDTQGEAAYTSRMSQGDLFYKFFLGNYCLNHCCHKACKYKMLRSGADIRIGDLWGKAYASNQKGVSALIAFTPKGKEIVQKLRALCTLEPVGAAVVTQGQMRKCAAMPRIRAELLSQLRSGKSLVQIKEGLIRRYDFTRLPQRILRRLKRLFSK